MNQFIRLTEPDVLVAAGTPFNTTYKARWAERMARTNQNGLRGAFVRIGRSVYLDVDRFHELIREQSPTRNAGAVK